MSERKLVGTNEMFKKEIEQINNFYENVKDSIDNENLIIFSIFYNVMLSKLRNLIQKNFQRLKHIKQQK